MDEAVAALGEEAPRGAIPGVVAQAVVALLPGADHAVAGLFVLIAQQRVGERPGRIGRHRGDGVVPVAGTEVERQLDALERDGQVLFRYVRPDGDPALDPDERANPNGSLRAIAGVTNAAGNVAGLMPHPETAVETLLGSADGLPVIRSFVEAAGLMKFNVRIGVPEGYDSDPAFIAAARAGGALTGLEAAEAGQLDVLALGEVLDDHVEGRVDDLLGGGRGGSRDPRGDAYRRSLPFLPRP